MTRPSAGALLRVAVAAGLTAYIFWKSEPQQALQALVRADWRLVAAAVGLVLIDRALNAYRWLVLLRPLSPAIRPPFPAILHVFFVSTFVGTFLPGSVGGDAVRAVSIARYGVGLADAVASVLLDRVFGTLSILLVAAAAALYAPPTVPAWVPAVALATAVVGSIGLALSLFSNRMERYALGVARRTTGGRLQKAGVSLIEALRRYAAHGSALVAVLAASVVVQLLRIAQAWLLGLSLGIPAGPATYLIYVPVILLVMLLPITINGLGTSQWAFVALFGFSGVEAADAFALSVLFLALGVLGNLPGGILYAAKGLTAGTGEAPERSA